MNPQTAARRWAAEHPDQEAQIIVYYASRYVGRPSEKIFYAAGGQVAAEQLGAPATCNGICQCCGGVYLAPVIRQAWASDPDAGQPLPPEQPWLVDRYFRHDLAYVYACPDCITRHHLQIRPDEGRRYNWQQNAAGQPILIDARPHPTLARVHEAPMRVEIALGVEAAPTWGLAAPQVVYA